MKTRILSILALFLTVFSSCEKTYVCDATITTSEPFPNTVQTSIEIEMTKEEAKQFEEDNTFTNTFTWPEEYTETVITECK